MSEEVGKIKLGLDINADLSGQLNQITKNISSQLAKVFKENTQAGKLGEQIDKSMQDVDTTLTKTLTKVDSMLNKMMSAINSAVDELIEKLKSLNAMQFNPAQEVSSAVGNINVPQPRGPPIKATKEDLIIKRDLLREQSNQVAEQVDKLKLKLNELNEQFTRLGAIGESNAKNRVAKEIDKTTFAIDRLKNKLGKLGYDLEIIDRKIVAVEEQSTKSTDKVSVGMDKINSKMAKLKSSMNATIANISKKSFRKLGGLFAFPFNRTIKGFKKIGDVAHSAGMKGAKGFNVLDRSFWRVFRRLFVLGTIAKILRGLTGYIGDALMANKSFRDSLATTQLNLAAAFQPIMDIIIPALVKFMAVVAKATGYMAAFVATMFGTTYKASVQGAKNLKAQTDAYKELGKSSKGAASKVDKAAKKMKGSLAGFDEINTITIKDDIDNKSVEEPKQSGWQNAAMTEIGDTSHFDKFKKILEGLFKPFQESWRNEGQNTINAAKYAFHELKELAKSVGKSIYEVWTNGTGTEILDSMQRNLQNILLLLGDVAKSFRYAWDDEGRGTQIIQNIGDAILNTLQLLESITGSIREVWAQVGDDIAVNSLEIVKNVTHLFAEIPKTFKESWDKNQIGTEFLQHIGDGFNNLLGLVSQVTGALDGLWAKFGPSITDTVMQCLNATAGLFESMTIGFRGVWDNGGNHLFESIGRLGTRIFELAGRIYSEFIAPIAGKLLEVLGPALGKVLDFVAGILDKFSELIEWLLKDGNPAFEILGAIITSLGLIFIGYKAKILAVDIATKLLTKTTAIATAVSGAFSKALAFICTPAGAIVIAILAIIAIGVLLYKHWDEVGPKLAKIWEATKKFFSDIKTAAVNFVTNFIKGLVKFFSDLINNVGQGIWRILQAITGFLGKFLKAGFDLLINLARGIGNGMGRAVQAMRNVGNNIKNAISRINLFNIGANLIKGLWNGISSVTDWILDKLGGFCDSVVDTVKDWFGIASPSKVFKNEIGKWIPRGMAIGIEAETGKVTKAMDDLMKIPTLQQPELAFTSDVKPKEPADKDKIVKEIIELLNPKPEGNDGDDGDTTVVLQVDEDVLGKVVVKNINKKTKQNGKPVIIV